MTSIPNLKTFFAILLLSLALPLIRAEDIISDNGIEVRTAHNSCYLSDLGLKVEDLSWGVPVNGISMAALSIPSKKRDINNGEQATIVFSIQNKSKSPLIIPIVNALPDYYCYSSKDKPRKLFFKYATVFSIGGPTLVKLNPGKMITFTMNYSKRHFDEDDKEHVPMVFSVDFKGVFGEVLPDFENGLVLESQEVKYPY